jgi:hypothetical protein
LKKRGQGFKGSRSQGTSPTVLEMIRNFFVVQTVERVTSQYVQVIGEPQAIKFENG